MAIALALIKKSRVPRRLTLTYKMTFSGNYATGGDTLTIPDAPAGHQPIELHVDGDTGVYLLRANPETVNDATTLKMLARDLSAAGAEVGAGAYPGGLTAKNPTLVAVYAAAW